VLEADVDGPQPYLVTEFVAGPSLYEHVTQRGPVPRESIEALATGIATALTSIHGAGLAHGDLTPRNVLLSESGPKVIDFGVAGLAEQFAPSTGAIFGTPGWLAPERLAGGAPSMSSDVHTWALLVVWAATGHRPSGRGPADLAALPTRLASLV
jgi:serine/threonine protein kinase